MKLRDNANMAYLGENMEQNNTAIFWTANEDNLTESNVLRGSTCDDLATEDLGPQRDPLFIVIPITIMYLLIFLTGLVGNVITCLVIMRNRYMHTPTNYYLVNLAVSDLLLLVTGMPQEVYSIWSRYPYIFGEPFCVLRGLVSETSANATVLTVTAFTVERYVAICHPLRCHTGSKLTRAFRFVLLIWVLAICFAIPQALQFGLVFRRPCFGPDAGQEIAACVVKRILIQHSFEISSCMFFLVPMTVITVLYVLIGFRLKRSSITARKCTVLSRGEEGSGRKQILTPPGSRPVVKMLVVVVAAFFICWAPFHAQRLLAIHGSRGSTTPSKEMLSVYDIITYLSGILYYLSTTVNPLVYHIMSHKFREAFKDTYFCLQNDRKRLQRRTYSILTRSLRLHTDEQCDAAILSRGSSLHFSRQGSVRDIRKPFISSFQQDRVQPSVHYTSTCLENIHQEAFA